MLRKDRIREAQKNVKIYLEEGLLKKMKKPDERIMNLLVKNSDESLKIANMLFERKLSWLWTIVTSYYAMYYIANAVLYKLGYKIGHKISHKITADALILFVRNKLRNVLIDEFEEAQEEAMELAQLKTDELIGDFDLERRKRSKFQYEMTEEIKITKAKTSLERAKTFCFELRKILMEQI